MVLGILGIGLLLSYYGLSTYAVPVLGEAYLTMCKTLCAGQHHLLGWANPERPLRGLLALLGRLHPIWLWRLGFQGAAQVGWGPLGPHAPLFTAPLPNLFSVLGALLLLSRRWVDNVCRLRRPPARGASAEPESRAST